LSKEGRSLRARRLTLVIVAAVLCAAGAAARAQNAAAAATLKNPVASNASSLASGKKLYDAQCASCHGAAGKGDGKAGALLKPKPSDLTDDVWTHGSTDGEIFTVIRSGVKQTGMAAYGSRITTQEIWHLVNYVRTLGPRPTPSQ
jgi:cbb3-type cytochrome c oxidase subunit III